jgi:hypothetical protein
MRCQATKKLAMGSGVLVCDLDQDEYHLYHDDKVNEILWRAYEAEEYAEAAVPVSPFMRLAVA